eukprot:NODE_8866_length_364_cov_111.637540.p2 GENE.NODE_8866_length_364_cov_111.637540~~NODE_8866_length_364_cov_111.637540.p2  ORF type:complete len:105 (+),score=65.71 NODE_8866_length_364_cov_111.637540:29-316(+)
MGSQEAEVFFFFFFFFFLPCCSILGAIVSHGNVRACRHQLARRRGCYIPELPPPSPPRWQRRASRRSLSWLLRWSSVSMLERCTWLPAEVPAPAG